jgi:hypothetical protein
MRQKVLLCAMAAIAVVASCGGDEHHPPGDESDDGDDGDGATAGPDAATSEPPESVSVADACVQIAQDWCEATIVCELDTPTPGQETMPACKREREAECFAHRTAPVPSEDLDACLSQIAARECATTMLFPGRCFYLWDTEPPDAGVDDAGVPDAAPGGVDAGLDAGIDASLPDAALVDG